MESSAAPRQRGEREAPENTKSVRLHRAQELLELLAAVVLHRRPLRAVVPDAAALDGFRDGWVGVDRPADHDLRKIHATLARYRPTQGYHLSFLARMIILRMRITIVGAERI